MFTVSFAERSLDEIRALEDGFADERPFAAVARASEVQAQIYDAVLRTAVRAAVTQTGAELRRLMTPDYLYVFAASGNFNPMHLPSGDLNGDDQPKNVAPGMFVALLISAVLGTLCRR